MVDVAQAMVVVAVWAVGGVGHLRSAAGGAHALSGERDEKPCPILPLHQASCRFLAKAATWLYGGAKNAPGKTTVTRKGGLGAQDDGCAMIARVQRIQRRPRTTILDAIADPLLFAQHFKDPSSWTAWRAFLAALFALPMTPEQVAIFQKHTGRQQPPTEPLHESWLVCGRRSGKSFVLALCAVFLSCFRDWRPFLAVGEVGTVMVIAADRRQARVIMRYVKGLLNAAPMLARQVIGEKTDTITLQNQVCIEIHSASFKTTRGYAIVAALLDELAFWPTDDAAEPDYEIISALRPGMATIPRAMLLCASSPYARRGALWDAHRKHFGRDGDPVLVWQADTSRSLHQPRGGFRLYQHGHLRAPAGFGRLVQGVP
jgi:hypothetical protein